MKLFSVYRRITVCNIDVIFPFLGGKNKKTFYLQDIATWRYPLNFFPLHHRIVNIITVRRGGNLDRCKTTRNLRHPLRTSCVCVYAFGCNRLANETFRFTKSSETREPCEWGRKSLRPDVNIPPSLSSRTLPYPSLATPPSARVLQILLHSVDVTVLKAMAVKRHWCCSGPDLISCAYSTKTP